jgi:hypothetical protein
MCVLQSTTIFVVLLSNQHSSVSSLLPSAAATPLHHSVHLQRGLSEVLARQVAVELSAHDVVKAHARDELGIDMDDLAK